MGSKSIWNMNNVYCLYHLSCIIHSQLQPEWTDVFSPSSYGRFQKIQFIYVPCTKICHNSRYKLWEAKGVSNLLIWCCWNSRHKKWLTYPPGALGYQEVQIPYLADEISLEIHLRVYWLLYVKGSHITDFWYLHI